MARLVVFVVSALVAALGWPAAVLAAGPFGTIQIGNWRGGAFTDKAGAFSACSASTKYRSGVSLIIGRGATGTWLLGFVDPNWHFTQGETFPVEITFDGQAQFHLFALPVGATPLFTMPVPPGAALDHLGKARMMAAVIKGRTYQFTLTSADQVLSAIEACYVKVKAGGVASAEDFSHSRMKPTASEPAAHPAVASSAAPPAPAPAQPGKKVNVSGTGFVVSANGFLVTNHHVIKNCVGDIHGNLANGEVMTLRLASSDPTNDLALLQAPSTFPEPAAIRASGVRSGESVIAIGFPYHGLLTSDFTVTTGIVSSLSGPLNDTRYLQTSAPIQPGNSGGPILDTSGSVVGVAAKKFNALKFATVSGGNIPENINFGIKTGVLRDFLDNSVVPYKTADVAGSELKTPDVAAKARAYTMLVSCTATAE